MELVINDGGRSKYFKTTDVGDCVTRAICNATGLDYKEVYDGLNKLAKSERTGKRKKGVSSARDGVYKDTIRKYLDILGWKWHPTMAIGSGCKVHLCKEELPSGVLIVNISKHTTCVKDGVIYDTWNCSIDKYKDWDTGEIVTAVDKRCVYGYWTKE